MTSRHLGRPDESSRPSLGKPGRRAGGILGYIYIPKTEFIHEIHIFGNEINVTSNARVPKLSTQAAYPARIQPFKHRG